MKFRTIKFTFLTYLKHYLTIPLVLGMLIPIVFLDVCLEIYHRISFPILKIPVVKRSRYIRIDRYKLPYLRWYDKIFCAYCEYGNGLLHYASIIAGETEKYWCGIKHEEANDFIPPRHHKNFVIYGDKDALEKQYPRPPRKNT